MKEEAPYHVGVIQGWVYSKSNVPESVQESLLFLRKFLDPRNTPQIVDTKPLDKAVVETITNSAENFDVKPIEEKPKRGYRVLTEEDKKLIRAGLEKHLPFKIIKKDFPLHKHAAANFLYSTLKKAQSERNYPTTEDYIPPPPPLDEELRTKESRLVAIRRMAEVENKSDDQIADKLGFSAEYVKHLREQNNIKSTRHSIDKNDDEDEDISWSDDDKEEIKSMIDSGRSIKAVAGDYGVTENQIQSLINGEPSELEF